MDIKGPNLIKGIHLEGLRIVGNPSSFANKYYLEGIDELIFIDCVASLYGRKHLYQILQEAVKKIFIPLTVGGGIRSVEDVKEILRCGADKVAINTAAVKNPRLISNIANYFGSQCMVSSIQAKQSSRSKWEVCINNGRDRTGLDVIDWAKKCVKLGAGEILLTSIDREGTRKGFDFELIKSVTSSVDVPVIASGGMGELAHLNEAILKGNADAVAMADILHYSRESIASIRTYAKTQGLKVRNFKGSN